MNLPNEPSKSVKRLNPQLYGDDRSAWEAAQLEPNPGNGPVGALSIQEEGPKRILVRVTSIRHNLLDEDNLCEKFIVDCCRYAGLIPADDPATTKIEVYQRKASKDEMEKTIIEIIK